MKRILIGLVLVLASFSTHAQQPTQAQTEAFRNLPQAEQQRLMREMGITAPTQAPARLPQDEETRPRRPRTDDSVEPLAAEVRIEAGDTLSLNITGEAPPALLGRRVLSVDTEGRVRLPALGRIMVAGLNADQAAERLAAEPALREAQIRVQVLPVQRDGLSRLRPFGYELFRDSPSTFAPTTAVPVPANYQLGPGDILNIQLFGQHAGFYGLEVTREGQVLFPQLGPITVAGLSFSEAQALLIRRVEEQMIGVRASITMGPLRTIRVFVLGEAHQPGAYTVSALTTATHALFVSGGVRKVGSLRNIEIKRGGETISRLDLYDLLLRGDTRGDVRLQADDVVFIPPAGDQVAIDGEVRRPAIYELRDERTLEALVGLAGGTLATAFPPLTRIERISTTTGERELLTVDLAQRAGQTTRLRAGDYVSVASVLDRIDGMVRLSGHIHRPVVREYRDGLRISDLIPDIAVLQAQPDLDYALLRREVGPTRRVEVESVSLARVLAEPRGAHDLALQANDELIVFGVDEMDERRARVDRLLDTLRLQASATDPVRIVSVQGQVRASGSYPLEPGMRLSDLVQAGGGLAEAAYVLEAEITRRYVTAGDEEKIEHFLVDLSRVLEGVQDADVRLQSRDILSIRLKPNWSEERVVTLRGEVRFPGEYAFRKDETLAQIIARAGGLTSEAYPRGSVFTREALREREQLAIDEMASRLEMNIATARIDEQGQLVERVDAADALVRQLRETRAVGRLVIDLERALANAGNREFDIEVVDGDTLIIPPRPQSVTIIGEVHFPTSHLWERSMRVDSYLNLSGGMTTRADRRGVYIVRANGAVEPVARRGRARTMEPGDTIVVPLDADRIPRLTLWTNVSQIFYQIGVAAAAWKTVGVF